MHLRPSASASPDGAVNQTALAEAALTVVRTPGDFVAAIHTFVLSAGRIDTALGFTHHGGNRKNNRHSWDRTARYVIPEIRGLLEGCRTERQTVGDYPASFDRAGQAVLSKIMSHEGAAAALKAGMEGNVAMRSPNAPDLNKAAEAMKG